MDRLIRSEAEYDEIVGEIQRLLDAHPDPDARTEERIEFLSLLVEDYDRKHYELPGPDLSPQQIVEFMLDMHDIDRSALADAMGGRSRVSEFFSAKRPLSTSQLQALRALLHVPADLLLGDVPAAPAMSKKAPAASKAPRVVTSRVREPSPAIKRAAVHVVPSPTRGVYHIQIRGKSLSTLRDKNAAIARATEIARNNKTSITIHSSSGRITTRQVGKDPKPPRDRR